MLYVALYTGMRVGEVGGLQWKDIDFEKNIIYIRRALVNFTLMEKEIVLSSTKNRKFCENNSFCERCWCQNIMAEQFGDSKLKLITELDVIDFLEDGQNPTHAVSSE